MNNLVPNQDFAVCARSSCWIHASQARITRASIQNQPFHLLYDSPFSDRSVGLSCVRQYLRRQINSLNQYLTNPHQPAFSGGRTTRIAFVSGFEPATDPCNPGDACFSTIILTRHIPAHPTYAIQHDGRDCTQVRPAASVAGIAPPALDKAEAAINSRGR